ncbi:DUF1428 domain-containing protein [Qipengyuania sp.]|uniref:DUF1428 domain-containing protein n=1 Tax=Qipengyuania sp. TaxID=2004515 RepID=UPI0035C7C9FD
MGYVEGFLIAVPRDRRADYERQARAAAPIFMDLGATRIVETWSDDIKHGETTDFYRAVKAEDGEDVVFSWIEYPDKATRDDAVGKMMEDPRFEALGEMPFDGKRMIFGGFSPIFDTGAEG